MSVIKCKMCGGNLKLVEGASTAECEYCGSVQTVPVLDDEKKLIQFERAERLRKQCEFDKAAGIYETIVADFRQEAEAYWGLVLCKYGIEYVEDPATGKKVPTCHRSSFESIMDNSDFEQTLENADSTARRLYREEAKLIEEIRKGIVAVSSKEEPYDIFICYKETDDKGERTIDSVLAQDVYDALTEKGYRVFFSRISLEDKLGVEYEPYIFAALNSAKIMLAFGTDYEYFNAVWVKNEWSRFLKLMAQDKQKHLIPCYKGIDAYDLPKEFTKLQAQDLGKVGAIQDLLRGIEKLLPLQKTEQIIKETVVQTQQSGGNTAPLLERAFMFLEDGDWAKADEYCEKVLDIDPKNARAYLGKLMAELKIGRQEALTSCIWTFEYNENYQKAVRYADDSLKSQLKGYIDHINTRNENARIEGIYLDAVRAMHNAQREYHYKEAAKLFADIREYKDAAALERECYDKAEAERLRIAKRNMKIAIIATPIVVALDIFTIILFTVIIPNSKYNKAVDLMDSGKYSEAISAFEALDGYKDSKDKIAECANAFLDAEYAKAVELMDSGKYSEAISAFEALDGYKDSYDKIEECEYASAVALMDSGKYGEAISAFEALDGYKDSYDKIEECEYASAVALMDSGKYGEAISAFEALDGYKDSYNKIEECEYASAVALMDSGKYGEAISAFEALDGYRNSADQILQCQYNIAMALLKDGNEAEAVFAFLALGNYSDAKSQAAALWDKLAVRETVVAGSDHTVGLKANGTVVAVGYNKNGQCDVGRWQDIVAVSAGAWHTVGLKADGTVVVVGYNNYGQCDVGRWQDIVAISAGDYDTVGLKADGTVVAVGGHYNGQCDVGQWQDIVAISAGSTHTVGLKADGTVVAVGWNAFGQCDVGRWQDIVAISAGSDHTVGLKADGTVVAVGYNSDGQCDVGRWQDIVAISAGYNYTVGLKADGTVVAVGWNTKGQRDVSRWKDIVAISAGSSHTVGLKADGTVVAAGDNGDGQCNVDRWKDIKLPTKKTTK